MTDSEWVGECAYIQRRTERRKFGLEFNNDIACFIRYCIMQRDTATREGYHDSAAYIQHCIDDML